MSFCLSPSLSLSFQFSTLGQLTSSTIIHPSPSCALCDGKLFLGSVRIVTRCVPPERRGSSCSSAGISARASRVSPADGAGQTVERISSRRRPGAPWQVTKASAERGSDEAEGGL